MSKSKASHELDPMVRLRESVKTALTALNGVLDAVNAVCDAATAPKKPAEQAKAKPQTPAPKPAKQPAQPAKAPAKPQTPASKPTAKPAKPAAAPTKAEPTDEQASAQPAKQVKKASASVRLTSHELTLNIGAQPVRELAEADAKDLLNNPKIFWYRPIQFPDPKRYQVQPRIESARVVERKAAKFTRAPWTVSVTIAAIGDDKRCESWLSGVLAKNKGEQE